MAARRILIINNRVPYPLNDGGNIAVSAMIDTYRHAGWEVFLLAMNTSRHYILPEKLAAIYKDIHAFETVDIDNSLKPSAFLKNLFFSVKPNHADRFFDQEFVEKLREVIREFKPDVVQVESIYLTEYLSYIKAETDALTVLRLHNIESQVWQRLGDNERNPVRWLFLQNLASRLKRYEKKAWKKYDLLLPITGADAAAVKKTGTRSEILTVPLGIDFSDIPAPADNIKWAGYHIGAMDWKPNADGIWWFLHKVWPFIHSEFSQFRFYFAGRNMPLKFKKLKLPNVICEGQVMNADDFIADKKILFVPIHSGGGLRIKILEAMAQEKLVVSTDVGMQGINATPGRHYLAANTKKEFMKAVRWVLMHNKDAGEIGKQAAAMVREYYNKDIVSASLLDKVNEMLNQK